MTDTFHKTQVPGNEPEKVIIKTEREDDTENMQAITYEEITIKVELGDLHEEMDIKPEPFSSKTADEPQTKTKPSNNKIKNRKKSYKCGVDTENIQAIKYEEIMMKVELEDLHEEMDIKPEPFSPISSDEPQTKPSNKIKNKKKSYKCGVDTENIQAIKYKEIMMKVEGDLHDEIDIKPEPLSPISSDEPQTKPSKKIKNRNKSYKCGVDTENIQAIKYEEIMMKVEGDLHEEIDIKPEPFSPISSDEPQTKPSNKIKNRNKSYKCGVDTENIQAIKYEEIMMKVEGDLHEEIDIKPEPFSPISSDEPQTKPSNKIKNRNKSYKCGVDTENIQAMQYEEIMMKVEGDLHEEIDIKPEPFSPISSDEPQTKPSNKIKNRKTSYKCGVCHKTLSCKNSLENHTRVHTGARPFKCSTCEKTFKTVQHLERHNFTHNGDNPRARVECSLCQKTFSDTSGLQRHKIVHSDDKPYKCSVCKKTFRQAGHLTDHMKTHTGSKPFKCNLCSYQCTTSSYLKQHVRVHSGEKPYSCQYCKLTFSSSRSKIRHIQRKHTK